MVARYTTERWRSRVYAIKYVLSLGVSSVAIPLVSFLHGSMGGFQTLFLTMAGCVALITLGAIVLLPTALAKPVLTLEPMPQPVQTAN